jgi:hypothetical protein
MSAETVGHFKDAVEVGMKPAILAFALGLLQGLLDDVFGEDRFVAMGPVLGWIGLEIETEGICPLVFVRLESS